jgi:hypothetical protein
MRAVAIVADLPALPAPDRDVEAALVAYARDRMAAGHSIVVHRPAPGSGPGALLEIWPIRPGVAGSDYAAARYPTLADGSISADFSKWSTVTIPAATAKRLVRVAIRSLVRIPTDPSISDGSRELELVGELRKAYHIGGVDPSSGGLAAPYEDLICRSEKTEK